MKEIELGVELELECEGNRFAIPEAVKNSKLVQDVGYDCSLDNGREIRFRHPTLKGWKNQEIESILKALEKNGFKQAKTAGMHIHVSGPKAEQVARRAKLHLDDVQIVLLPISARNNHNGLWFTGNNAVHDQFDTFGTVEFRVWESTTNTKIFKDRLLVAKAFYRFLLKDDPITDFFKKMPKYAKAAYLRLLNDKNNPHLYGMPVADVLKQMA
jgi:hypothetical protein